VIEQFWFRTDRPGVFFLMDVEAVEQARSTVEALLSRSSRPRRIRPPFGAGRRPL
jgi:hypothetical protein